MDINKIEERLKKEFKLSDFHSLIDSKANRYRVILGGDLENEERAKHAKSKAIQILKHNFENKSIWIRLVLWDEVDEAILQSTILKNLIDKIKFKKIEDDSLVLFLYFDSFNEIELKKLVESSINYELGFNPSINMTCFYFNFETPILINIYDDRGMDLVGNPSRLDI